MRARNSALRGGLYYAPRIPSPQPVSFASSSSPSIVRSIHNAQASRWADRIGDLFSVSLRESPLRKRYIAVSIYLVFFAPSAFAYIDPNTGGYLFQLLAPLAAIALSVWMFFTNHVKAMWRSFLNILTRKKARRK